MRKAVFSIFCFFALSAVLPLYADALSPEETAVPENSSVSSSVTAASGGHSEVPAAKRPLPPDGEKASAAAARDESDKVPDEYRDTLRYGIASEITELIDTLMENDDPRFSDELYDLFDKNRNPSVRSRILSYFAGLKDPCLEDFAVTCLNDPYDESAELVKAVFRYTAAVKCSAAVPAVISLIESENESYFSDAVSTLGEIGGESEALFLAEYLDRDDLSAAQRQSVMRVIGRMKSDATWDRLVAVLEDNDENAFVRMYAAEAIGQMKKAESVPVLADMFSSSDPNLRQYVIKGLSNYPDVVEAKSIIMQGIRDDHVKVRLESVKAAASLGLSDSVPFLIYRIRNDSEQSVKNESISALASLNTSEGNGFLLERLAAKKVADSEKARIAEALLKEGHAGEVEIAALAEEALRDDRRKPLRASLGKTLAKYTRPSFADVCTLYLESSDAQTVSLGLDMYRNGKFPSSADAVRKIADSKKSGANRTRARKLLGIQDDDADSPVS